MKIFPDYFSEDIIEQIKKVGHDCNYVVYRVDKYGNQDKTAFLNYYEEVLQGLKIVKNKQRSLERYLSDIRALSVSCYIDYNDIDYYYRIQLKKDYPQRHLLKGVIDPNDGPSRKTHDFDSHVDWWLYKNAQPHLYFNIINEGGA